MGNGNYRTLKVNDEAYAQLLRVISHLQLKNSTGRVTTSQAIVEMAKAYRELNGKRDTDQSFD